MLLTSFHSPQEVTGDDAQYLAKEFPGLFVVDGEGESCQAKVTKARKHEKLLEKVNKP